MEQGLKIIIGEKDYWGRGLGEEALNLLVKFAFNEMNLRKIKAFTFSDNEAAIKLYEKCGFVKEGVLQEEIFKNGMFKDVILMSFRGGRK